MCEAIKVTLQEQPPASNHPTMCHCRNCRTQSGATGSLVMLVAEEDVKVEGELTKYLDKKTTTGKSTPLDVHTILHERSIAHIDSLT